MTDKLWAELIALITELRRTSYRPYENGRPGDTLEFWAKVTWDNIFSLLVSHGGVMMDGKLCISLGGDRLERFVAKAKYSLEQGLRHYRNDGPFHVGPQWNAKCHPDRPISVAGPDRKSQQPGKPD